MLEQEIFPQLPPHTVVPYAVIFALSFICDLSKDLACKKKLEKNQLKLDCV